MKLLNCAIAAALISSVVSFYGVTACAQQAPLPQPELILRVLPADVDVIGKALGKLPFEEVAPLINKLRQQIVDQQAKPTPAVPQPEPKKE